MHTTNTARKEWLDTLPLAERLEYDKAFGQYWFSKGPWPAAAHQHAKNLIQHRRHPHAAPQTGTSEPSPPQTTTTRPVHLVNTPA